MFPTAIGLILLCGASASGASPRPRPRTPTVDVLITTYNEPIDLVMTTARAAKAIRRPHRTWISVEGHDRPDFGPAGDGGTSRATSRLPRCRWPRPRINRRALPWSRAKGASATANPPASSGRIEVAVEVGCSAAAAALVIVREVVYPQQDTV